MRDQSTGNSLYPGNFVQARVDMEAQKYGRVPGRSIPQFVNPDHRHSIEPPYGQYDRPINEAV